MMTRNCLSLWWTLLVSSEALSVRAWVVSLQATTTRNTEAAVHQRTPAAASLRREATSTSSSEETNTADVNSAASNNNNNNIDGLQIFDDFVDFLKEKQTEIIQQLEDMDTKSGAKFTRDGWGIFDENVNTSDSSTVKNGGITRVLQGGDFIEKGACSLTLIQEGVLTADRAATLRSRQGSNDCMVISAGDLYAAAALSMVLHSRSPLVPTFRSDVRVFLVYRQNKDGDDVDDSDSDDENNSFMAWFGGGADLTPYYLYPEDIAFFHSMYRDLCLEHWLEDDPQFSYKLMKKSCDDYFYLPARSEHRGTGGIFFDDMAMTAQSLAFVKGVANAWMPSWLPIVKKRRHLDYTEAQRQWQLLRRGRYLEFNLLYDRGVKFGLANANPRVEGVMVSAPPLIAFEYNHEVVPGSEEDKLMTVLKTPRDWA